MKKAQNLVEIALLLIVVIAVSIVGFSMYNNIKIKATDMSKVNVRVQGK